MNNDLKETCERAIRYCESMPRWKYVSPENNVLVNSMKTTLDKPRKVITDWKLDP